MLPPYVSIRWSNEMICCHNLISFSHPPISSMIVQECLKKLNCSKIWRGWCNPNPSIYRAGGLILIKFLIFDTTVYWKLVTTYTGSQLIPMHLHIGCQFKLCPATVRVLFLTAYAEIFLACQIVCQKTDVIFSAMA